MVNGLRSLAPALSALTLMAIASAGATAQDKVTIRFASFFGGSHPMAEVLSSSLDKWEAAHPEVTLVRESSVGDDHRIKLATDLAANNTPDVFLNWTTPGDINKFIESGAVLDVREIFSATKTLKADHWRDDQLAVSSVDGVPYGLPDSSFKCFMMYNTVLFDQYGQNPPTTWDELLAVSKVFIDNGIVPINQGSKGGNPGHLFYSAILDQLPNGYEDTVASAASHNVSTDAMRSAGKMVLQMRELGLLPEDSIANGDWPPSLVLYNQSKAAMIYTCSMVIASIDPAVSEVSQIMSLPDLPGSTRPGNSFTVGTVNTIWMANKASWEDPNKRAAMASLIEDVLVSDEVINTRVVKGSFPFWNATDEEITSLGLPSLTSKVMAYMADKTTLVPLVNFMTTGGSISAYLEAIDRIFAGQDPDTVFNDFQTTVNREVE